MRRALIGDHPAIMSLLSATGGYTDVMDWRAAGAHGRRRYDELVLVGLPHGDSPHPLNHMAAMRGYAARRVTLVSSLDVYPNPSLPLDEDAALDAWPNTSGGRAHIALERWAFASFDAVFVVRVPTLYGPGAPGEMDALMRGHTGAVNPAAVRQWYPASRLQTDLVIARHKRFPIVNLATEPLSTARIAARLFPGRACGPPAAPAPYSRLITKHAGHFGGRCGYIMRAEDVLADMAALAQALDALKPGRIAAPA
ncbi:MAG: hypothetical protein NW215_12685 [Hyphomicrobiales bacterium]|nr:hypothetical protein [Hyphomicrobiales bacterium]